MPPLFITVLQVLHARKQESAALFSVLPRKISEMTNMWTGNKIKTVHRNCFLLHGLNEDLDVPVADHLVGCGVQVQVWPRGRPLLHSIVVVLMDVLGQRVQNHSQQEHSHSEQAQEDVSQNRSYVGPQGGRQGPQSAPDVPAARGAVHHGPDNLQGAEVLVAVQQLHHVAVQHEAAVAEDVEEDGAVLHLVVEQDLQQLEGSDLQLPVAEGLGDEDRLQGGGVADGDTALAEQRGAGTAGGTLERSTKECCLIIVFISSSYLFIVDRAVFREVLVLAASPAQQDHHRLLCPLPVSV